MKGSPRRFLRLVRRVRIIPVRSWLGSRRSRRLILGIVLKRFVLLLLRMILLGNWRVRLGIRLRSFILSIRRKKVS